MTVVNVKGQKYHMDKKLKPKWDRLKDGKLTKVDEDRFYICDGREGSGKSLFVLQQAAYIDPTILENEGDKKLPRICFTVDEFLKAISRTKSTKNQTKCVVFDEAFRGMSSKTALSKVNKIIMERLMEVRQNNLVVFLVTPSYYFLEFYPAVLRSNALFHIIKEKNSRRRYVRIFNFKKKALLYNKGARKGWGYPVRTYFRVRFFNSYPGGEDFEKRYRKKKRESLQKERNKPKKKHRWKLQRNSAIRVLYNLGKTYKEISESMRNHGTRIGVTQIGSIISGEY